MVKSADAFCWCKGPAVHDRQGRARAVQPGRQGSPGAIRSREPRSLPGSCDCFGNLGAQGPPRSRICPPVQGPGGVIRRPGLSRGDRGRPRAGVAELRLSPAGTAQLGKGRLGGGRTCVLGRVDSAASARAGPSTSSRKSSRQDGRRRRRMSDRKAPRPGRLPTGTGWEEGTSWGVGASLLHDGAPIPQHKISQLPTQTLLIVVFLFLVPRVLRHLGVAKPVEAAAGPTTVRDRTGCRLPVKRRDPVKSSGGKVMG